MPPGNVQALKLLVEYESALRPLFEMSYAAMMAESDGSAPGGHLRMREAAAAMATSAAALLSAVRAAPRTERSNTILPTCPSSNSAPTIRMDRLDR